MINQNSAESDDQDLNQRESMNNQTQSPKRNDNNYQMRKIKANLESHRRLGARATDMTNYNMYAHQEMYQSATKVNHS